MDDDQKNKSDLTFTPSLSLLSTIVCLVSSYYLIYIKSFFCSSAVIKIMGRKRVTIYQKIQGNLCQQEIGSQVKYHYQ